MDLATFEDLLDRYGADPRAWPHDLRDDADAVLAASSAARAALADMRSIEILLHGDRPVPGGSDPIAARAMRHRQERAPRPGPRRVGWAVAASIVLASGFFLGGAVSNHDDGPEHVVAAALETTGSVDVD